MRFKLSTLLLTGYAIISMAVLSLEVGALGQTQAPTGKYPVPPWPADLGSPLSLGANQKILFMCEQSMSPPYSMFRPEQELRQVANSCADHAGAVIKWMPTHGFGHFVAAQAAHHWGEHDKRDRYLEKSQEFSPFEGWLSERRFALVAHRISPGVSPLEQVAHFDASVLLHTQSGAELLADYYVQRPFTRALVRTAALQANPLHQTRFANQLRQKLAGR